MRHHSGRFLMFLMLLALLGGLLTIFGCGNNGGGGDGDGDGFIAAAPADLANQVFAFADGRAFAPALADVAVTLTFGDFTNDGDGNPNTGPFRLTTAAGTARGTVTVGSCDLAVERSTLDAAMFPELQRGQTVPLDPCLIDPEDDSLQVENADTGEISTSTAANTIPTTDIAFVITSDRSTGSYSIVDIGSRATFNNIDRGGIHSDAIARVFNGLIYVVNRDGVDSIQIIDPQRGFTTPLNGELSVKIDTGPNTGSNAQDIAFVSPTKAYVSRLDSTQLLVINPTTLTITGDVDLSDKVKQDDLDGSPEMAYMLVHNERLYVALQHLDTTTADSSPVAQGEIVVINTNTDEEVTTIRLNGRNPFTELQFSTALDRILVSSIGNFFVNDGGIEAINPTTNDVDLEFVIDEASIGGDITHFQIVSATSGFAVVTDPDFNNNLVRFDPTIGTGRTATLLGPLDNFLPHFAINSLGELYLAQRASATTPAEGVRIFDTVTNAELTTAPINVGLPPSYVLFVE
jgi:hypothetical protein